jgi:hypothetical protein
MRAARAGRRRCRGWRALAAAALLAGSVRRAGAAFLRGDAASGASGTVDDDALPAGWCAAAAPLSGTRRAAARL